MGTGSKARSSRRVVRTADYIGCVGKTRYPRANERPVINLQPLSDLDLMIENGWGDTRQENIPKDWRTRMNPKKSTSHKGVC